MSDDGFYEIPCEGVVVRCRTAEAGDPAWEVAILFRDLAPEASRFLDTYVESLLSSQAG